MKRRLFSLLVVLMMLPSMLSACSSGSDPAEISGQPESTAEITPKPTETVDPAAMVIFTDSAGRQVEVPKNITKIAVSGPLAQIVLFSISPDMLVGIATEWDATAAKYFDSKYYNMPVLGQLYGGKGEMNLEELLDADPDVVIDVGDSKDTIAEDMDALKEQTGLPFIHIAAGIETMGDAYRILGELLGLEIEAEALAEYCESTYDMALDIANEIGEDNKISLLYCLGDQGLNVIAKDSYHSEIIDLLSNNLAIFDDPSSKGTGNETDLEQLLLWDPDMIIFAPNSAYDAVGSDPTWNGLTAISSGNYYEVPFGPYNWLGFPPSVQRVLGILWLTDLLYPDLTAYDLYEEVAEYYSMFYHCNLTKAQFDDLMANSK